MKLFRFIVSTEEGELPVIAAAESEEAALQVVDQEIQHNLLIQPKIRDVVLIEKKGIKKSGAGYLIQPRKSYE
ncbi:DUF3906 family protein [Sporolactobacillus shoreicorticis]|uniref:DUF3906 family protein n=1 Tax=Sporolactobacillus shoreicorticis TaxID=1923877 RepID=A0ABW5RZJ8_9BACL|nr:DUF3906 family protein [Sporolactobacillus shoreicorticis]MCO7125182.1 DUF3906 family protein [Sporolactobacillus shoreicorticis]